MSTTINITVDDGGLAAKNKQQTSANRQAYVQGQASQQAAKQGVDQRAADRRAAGLDPATGRPLIIAGASSFLGTSSFLRASGKVARVNQEPAANRFGENTAISHLWYFRTQLLESGFSTGMSSTFDDGFLEERTIPTLRTFDLLLSCGNGAAWATAQLGTFTPSDGMAPSSLDVPPWPATVSKTSSTLPIPSITQSYIVLPTGSGNSILTIINVYAWNKITTTGLCGEHSNNDPRPRQQWGAENYEGSSFSSGGEVSYFSFAINNSTVRPINTPAGLISRLEIFGPKLLTVDTSVGVWPTLSFDAVGGRIWVEETFPLKTIQTASIFLFADAGTALRAYNAELYSPLVYERLNQGTPYTDAIKQLRPGYKGFVADGRYGIYDKLRQDDGLTWQQLFLAGDTLDYAQWPVPAQTPSLDAWEPDYIGITPKRMPKKSLQLIASNPPGYDIPTLSVFADAMIAVTDWGDPAYCAGRALDLGFTAEDLIAEAP